MAALLDERNASIRVEHVEVEGLRAGQRRRGDGADIANPDVRQATQVVVVAAAAVVVGVVVMRVRGARTHLAMIKRPQPDLCRRVREEMRRR
jgi:hypothetical protein